MKIAVVGCSHGHLDEIYRTITDIEAKQGVKIELLLCCGDFEAIRNPQDLKSMSVPNKYLKMGDFYRYYSGEMVAPVLTIFIGGNHEASNYLQELPFGGWVARNIYFLGLAGVVRYRGLRIGGISGIYKPGHYSRGHYETMPYTESEKRSIYHVRNLDVFRLKLLQNETDNIDIFMSHDWPRGIWHFGNVNELLRTKPHFAPDIEDGSLGSIPGEEILHHLRPKFYFAGHMHCRFAAKVRHGAAARLSDPVETTRFLALDKVVAGRKYLEVVDIPLGSETSFDNQNLQWDPEWLCILKQTSDLWNSSPFASTKLPTVRKKIEELRPNVDHVQEIGKAFAGDFTVPSNFVQTAPSFRSGDGADQWKEPSNHFHCNPQTEQLCQRLKMKNPCLDWSLKTDERLLAHDLKWLNVEEVPKSQETLKSASSAPLEAAANSPRAQRPSSLAIDYDDDY